jgi:hypothetical protein
MKEDGVVKHPTREGQVVPKALIELEPKSVEESKPLTAVADALRPVVDSLKQHKSSLATAAVGIGLAAGQAVLASPGESSSTPSANKNTIVTSGSVQSEPWMQTPTPTTAIESAETNQPVKIDVEYTVVEQPNTATPESTGIVRESVGPRQNDYLFAQQGWDKQLHVNRDFNALVAENGNSLRKTDVRIVIFGFGAPDPASAPVAKEVIVAPTEQYSTSFITRNSAIDASQISSSAVQVLAARNNNATEGNFWESGGSSILGPIAGIEENTRTKITTVAVNEGSSIVNRRIEDGLRQMQQKFTTEIANGDTSPWVLLLPNMTDNGTACVDLMNQIRNEGAAAGKRVIFVVHAFGGLGTTDTTARGADLTAGGIYIDSNGTTGSLLPGNNGTEALWAPGQKPVVGYQGGGTTVSTNFLQQPAAIIVGVLAEGFQINPELTPQQAIDIAKTTAHVETVSGVQIKIPNHEAARAEYRRSLIANPPPPNESPTPVVPTPTLPGNPPTETRHDIFLPLVKKP